MTNILAWRKQPFVLAVLLVGALTLFVRIVFVQTFKTNDDVGLSMICSGCGYSDTPDPHLMFTNILLGRALAGLYTIFPNVAWYGHYLLIANIVGLTAAVTALLRKRATAVSISLVLIFFLAVGLNNLVLLQFTTAACMVSLGGVAMILSWLDDDIPLSPRGLARPAIAILLLIIGSLIRFESSLLIAILAALVFAVKYLLGDNFSLFRQARSFIASAGVIFMAVCAALALHLYNGWEYRQAPGWEDFYSANVLKCDFVDYGYGRSCSDEKKKEAQRAANWTDNDLLLAQNLFCLDTDRFSEKRMLAATQVLRGTNYSSLLEVFKDFAQVFENKMIVPILITSLLLFAVYQSSSLSRKRLAVLALLIIGLMLTLLVTLKLPEHVYFPIFSFFLFVLLYHIDAEALREKFVRSKLRLPVSLAACVMACVLLYMAHQNYFVRGQNIQAQNLLLRKAINDLKPDAQNLYIVWRDFFPYEYVLPFNNIRSYFKNFKILPLAFRASAPLAANRMKQFGLNLDNLGTQLTNKNIFLISGDELNPLMVTYLREHYGLDAKLKLCREYPEVRLRVYQIVRL